MNERTITSALLVGALLIGCGESPISGDESTGKGDGASRFTRSFELNIPRPDCADPAGTWCSNWDYAFEHDGELPHRWTISASSPSGDHNGFRPSALRLLILARACMQPSLRLGLSTDGGTPSSWATVSPQRLETPALLDRFRPAISDKRRAAYDAGEVVAYELTVVSKPVSQYVMYVEDTVGLCDGRSHYSIYSLPFLEAERVSPLRYTETTRGEAIAFDGVQSQQIPIEREVRIYGNAEQQRLFAIWSNLVYQVTTLTTRGVAGDLVSDNPNCKTTINPAFGDSAFEHYCVPDDARMSWLVSREGGLADTLNRNLELLHASVLGLPYSLLNGRAYDLTQVFASGATPPRFLR